MTDTLRYSRVDRVLADIPLDSVIIRSCVFIRVLGKWSSLGLVLVCGVPCTNNYLSTSSHCLGIRRHHADGAGVMKHVFRGNSSRPDTVFSTSEFIRIIPREIVAAHHHVNMFSGGVRCVRARWRCAAWKNIGLPHKRHTVGQMPPTSTLDMVYVDGAALEILSGVLSETGFIQGIGMDLALDVLLFADAASTG